MSDAPEQLLLRVLPPGEQAFDNFCGRANDEARARLQRLASGEAGAGEAGAGDPGAGVRLWLTGAAGAGKSHLLRATLRAAAQAGRPARYLSIGDLQRERARERAARDPAADGVAMAHAPWLLDDVEAIAGDAVAEAELMQLWNETAGTIVFASRLHPGACAWQLPDLRSRLLASEVFRLEPPDDDDLRALLLARAAAVGLALDDEVVPYLLRRLPRDPHSLSLVIEQLDLASWRQRRRVTLPLVREVLGQRSSEGIGR